MVDTGYFSPNRAVNVYSLFWAFLNFKFYLFLITTAENEVITGATWRSDYYFRTCHALSMSFTVWKDSERDSWQLWYCTPSYLQKVEVFQSTCLSHSVTDNVDGMRARLPKSERIFLSHCWTPRPLHSKHEAYWKIQSSKHLLFMGFSSVLCPLKWSQNAALPHSPLHTLKCN